MCAQAPDALPLAGTVQSNMAASLRCPLPCCASETHTRAADPGDEEGPKSHAALQGDGGRYPEEPLSKRVMREGFSEEVL